MHEWFPSEDKIICEGYERGIAVRQIADRIGVTRKAVIGRAARLGLRHKYPRGKGAAYKSDAAHQQWARQKAATK